MEFQAARCQRAASCPGELARGAVKTQALPVHSHITATNPALYIGESNEALQPTIREIRQVMKKLTLIFAALSLALAACPSPSVPTGPSPKTFKLRIENVARSDLLTLSTGGTATTSISPGLWAVHTSGDVLFTEGQQDAARGLEALAEDGDPNPLLGALTGASGVKSSGVLLNPGAVAGQPLVAPGQALEGTFKAVPGDRLSFATMFVQSNDLFFAPSSEGLPLFDGYGTPLSGELTGKVALWDAGTEKNQEPGVGVDQPPRQAGPNTGEAEAAVIRFARDASGGAALPGVSQVVKVTITPQ